MAHALGFFESEFKDLLCARRKVDLSAAVLPGPGEPLHDFLHSTDLEAKLAQDAAGDPTLLANQAEEQVFCADIVVAHLLSFLVCEAEHTPGSLCKSIHS
jgi:hypothetical protein